MAEWGPEDQREEDGAHMAIGPSLFNNSVSTLVDHLTCHYGEDTNIDTYVICARVRSASVPGGSESNRLINPGGELLAAADCCAR